LNEKVKPKIGLFLYDPGGKLGQAIDLESIVPKLAKTKDVVACEIMKNFPVGDGLGSIIDGIRAGRFNRILWVGRFSPEQKKRIELDLAVAGLNRYLNEWCDLEEQGIRPDGNTGDIRTKKAIILLQMSLARVRLLEPLEPLKIPGAESVLIIGAGTAGLHTAVALVEVGKRVYLIEKESGVGGKVASLSRLYPRICDPYCGLELAIQKLTQSQKVEFHTLAKVTGIEGGPGNFMVKVEKKPRYVDDQKCNGCGECALVCPVSLPEGSGKVPSRGEKLLLDRQRSKPPSLRAIHAAQPMAFPSAFVIDRQFCSPDCLACTQVCPTRAINLKDSSTEVVFRVGAVLVTTGWDLYPLSKVEEYGYGRYPNVITNLEMEAIIEDPPDFKEVGFLQCAGSRDERHLSYCSSVCCSVTLKQILHLKKKLPGARCYVFYQDIRTPGFNEELYQQVKSLEGVLFLRASPSSVKPEETGRLRVRVEDTFSGKELNLGLDLLVMAGGMIPSEGTEEIAQLLKLPRNAYGFFESHIPCHPEESQRVAVRVGGACRGPMSIGRAIESSQQAAWDILPFLEEAVEIEPTIPIVNLTKCDKCKRCMEECPYLSFYFDPNGFPAVDLGKCRQCGGCMGICPLSAVSLRHLTIQQLAAQIRAIKPSFIKKEEPVILAFLCENDAYHAAREAADSGLPITPNVFFLRVPCAGAVNNALVADALAFGIDGILIAGCPDGQCHYGKANQLVKIRSDDLAEKLQKMIMERERVRFESLEIRDSRKYRQLIYAYLEELRKLGPNPFKA